jgi:type IV secretory pathway VirB2 component (pilin)
VIVVFKKPVEVLDFKEFMNGNMVVTRRVGDLNEKMLEVYVRRRKLVKTVIRVGLVALAIYTLNPLPHATVHAATIAVSAAVKAAPAAAAAAQGGGWDYLIEKILSLLDPAAKIFGLIAGLAIMTGNGKIGLERLFWLSLGYITARKVEVWINFLNTI